MYYAKKADYQPWLVCLSAALFFYFVFFQVTMFNTISHDLMQDFHIHATKLGYLSSSYFFADALAIIPAGILIDRYSVRKIALLMMSACILATMLLAMTHEYPTAVFCRIITGVGNACAFLSSMQLAARWLPSKRLALGIGLIITIIMIGGIMSQTPLVIVISMVGWRGAMLLNAGVGLVFLTYMYKHLEDYPKDKQPKPVNFSWPLLLQQLKETVQNRQNWFCAFFTAVMNCTITLLGELWGIMYLTQARGLSVREASDITSMLFIGMIMGSPFLGWLSDTWRLRRLPMLITSSTLLFIALIVMLSPHLSRFDLSLSFLLLGFLASGQVLSYSVIAESNPPAITATAMSMVAIALNLVSFVIQPFFGSLVHMGTDAKIIHDVLQYSSHDFLRAMWLLPLSGIVSLVLGLNVYETFARSYTAQPQEEKEVDWVA